MPIVIEAPTPMVRLNVAIRKNLRVVFFGTPAYSVPALRRLLDDGWPVAMVVTAPDMPSGRQMLMTPSPVRTAAQGLGVPVRTPITLKDELFFNEFSELRPDLCVVVAYNKILPERYLNVPRLGFVNIHPSLLPAYRGPSPVRSAILDGCAATGVSVMLLDVDTDHGPLLATQPWIIPDGFDAATCESELFRLGAELLAATLPGFIDGASIPAPQDHSLATFTKKFTRADGRLDWNQPAKHIRDRVRALADTPGTWSMWGDKTLNIFHAHLPPGPTPPQRPGTVFAHAGSLAVACRDSALVVETIQLEGAIRMPASDFARGHHEFVGSILT